MFLLLLPSWHLKLPITSVCLHISWENLMGKILQTWMASESSLNCLYPKHQHTVILFSFFTPCNHNNDNYYNYCLFLSLLTRVRMIFPASSSSNLKVLWPPKTFLQSWVFMTDFKVNEGLSLKFPVMTTLLVNKWYNYNDMLYCSLSGIPSAMS